MFFVFTVFQPPAIEFAPEGKLCFTAYKLKDIIDKIE